MSGLSVPLSTASEQSYETPGYIYDHYARRFRYVVDLAASAKNAKCPVYLTERDDSFSHVWADLVRSFRGNPGPEVFKNPDNGTRAAGWLNPPFCQAGRWAERMAEEAAALDYGDVLTMLCLSNSIGTEWYKAVAPLCMTEIITPRFSYVHPDPVAAAEKWVRAGLLKGKVRRIEDWKPAAPSGSMMLLFSRLTVERRTTGVESLRIRHVEIKEPKEV